MPAALARGERLALILPGDNGSLQTMLEGIIRLTPPRYPSAELHSLDTMSSDTFDRLAAAGYNRVLVSCVRVLNLEPSQIVLFERAEGAWRGTATRSYPAPPGAARWSHVVAEAPLCL